MNTIDEGMPASPMTVREEKRRAAPGLISCALCGLKMREITFRHLKAAHRWAPEGAVWRYKERFKMWSVRSALSAQTRQEVGWTRSRIKREIRRIRQAGGLLNSRDASRRHGTIYVQACRILGSWEKAIAFCGMDYTKVRLRKKWTRRDILGWIHKRGDKQAQLRGGVVKKEHAGVYNAACRVFGGWFQAIQAERISGFKQVKLRKWDKESLIKALREFGPGATLTEVRTQDPGLVSAIWWHIGSWPGARAAAGFVPRLPRRPSKWTRGRIFEAIRSRSGKHSRLTTRVFSDLGGLPNAAKDMFGSWEKAVRAAGCSYITQRQDSTSNAHQRRSSQCQIIC
jgi:hypothetical protein